MGGIYTKLGEINGQVRNDLDFDGDLNDQDPGIAGVTIKLFQDNNFDFQADGPAVEVTTTDDDGFYSFTDLAPGRYIVQEIDPAGFTSTADRNGGNPNWIGRIDIDGNSVFGQDFLDGYQKKPFDPACLGDCIFFDTNCDGLQNDGDGGPDGVRVTLLGAGADGRFGTNDDTTESTFTDNGGFYHFEDLTPGEKYKVRFDLPDGFEFTQANNESLGDNKDSDVINFANGETGVITLSRGEFNRTVDAGIKPKEDPEPDPASIGDQVFLDEDCDGIRDNGEQNVAGVQVTLTGSGEDGVFGTADDITRTQTTNANGFYRFRNLDPDQSYKVTFEAPEGFKFTDKGQGNNRGRDSDVDPSTGMTDEITLSPGEYNFRIDAGLKPEEDPEPDPACIGDRVFLDTNGNGIQDGGEAGVQGVTVTLTGGGADGVIGTGNDDTTTVLTTNANGNYKFTNLNPGEEYKVTFSNLPNGFEFTDANQGNDDDSDSDANPNTGMTQIVTLDPGEYDDSLDAGIVETPTPTPTASLGDRAFLDVNRNGVDDNEPGVEGVTVTLTGGGPDGIIGQGQDTTETTTTDANGNYSFTNLNPGEEYKVTFESQPNLEFTTQNAGPDNVDSDVNPNNGMTQTVTLTPGENNTTLDAGYRLLANVEIDIEKFVRVESDNPGSIDGDLCDELGKPQSLTFEYRSASDSNYLDVQTGQDSDKAFISGSEDTDGSSYIVVLDGKGGGKKGGKKGGKSGSSSSGGSFFFQDTVAAGDDFTVSGDFSSETQILVFDDQAAFNSGAAPIQTIDYHTSCSQPIALGDQIGAVLLSGYNGEDGSAAIPDPVVGQFLDADSAPGPSARIGSVVDFLYEVSNRGDVAIDITSITDNRIPNAPTAVLDNGFNVGDTDRDNLLDVTETWVYAATERAQGGLQTNIGTVVGVGVDSSGTPLPGLGSVTDSDPANYTGITTPTPPPIQGDLCDELGKPESLTFEYAPGSDVITGQDSDKAFITGNPDLDGSSFVVVLDGKGGGKKGGKKGGSSSSNGNSFFADTVVNGDTFTASGDFSSETQILIYDDQNAFNSGSAPLQTIDYHTSCSQPIELGDVIGSATLVGYVGEDGGASLG